MSESHIEEAWGLNIPAKQLLVLLALCSRADDDTDITGEVAVDRLIWETGCSANEIQTILRQLRAKDLIQIRGDTYWICLENGEQRPDEPKKPDAKPRGW
jgi:hypothetical protein